MIQLFLDSSEDIFQMNSKIVSCFENTHQIKLKRLLRLILFNIIN